MRDQSLTNEVETLPIYSYQGTEGKLTISGGDS